MSTQNYFYELNHSYFYFNTNHDKIFFQLLNQNILSQNSWKNGTSNTICPLPQVYELVIFPDDSKKLQHIFYLGSWELYFVSVLFFLFCFVSLLLGD